MTPAPATRALKRQLALIARNPQNPHMALVVGNDGNLAEACQVALEYPSLETP